MAEDVWIDSTDICRMLVHIYFRAGIVFMNNKTHRYQCCGVGVETGVRVGRSRQYWLESESVAVAFFVARIGVGVKSRWEYFTALDIVNYVICQKLQLWLNRTRPGELKQMMWKSGTCLSKSRLNKIRKYVFTWLHKFSDASVRKLAPITSMCST